MRNPAALRLLAAPLAIGVLNAPATWACDGCGCCGTGQPQATTSGHGYAHPAPTGGGITPLALDYTPAGLGGGAGAFGEGSGGGLRFVVVGDTQGPEFGPVAFMPNLITSINAVGANNLLITGDLVGKERADTWAQWTANASAFSGGLSNVLMTPGNHDLPIGTDALWQSTFSQTPGGQPWLPNSQNLGGVTGLNQMDYYVDVGSTRFISVTTDTQLIGSNILAPQSLAWLEAAVQDADSNNAIEDVFVYTHHSITFDSTYGSTNKRGTQSEMWQAIATDSKKVRALFTGHWHFCQPSTPDPHNPDVWEVVAGTGGGAFNGRTAQNQHGFTVVDVLPNGRIEAMFFGDADGAANGWQFNDVMDRFVIADPNPRQVGIVAYYSFSSANQNLDTATGPLAKQNHGRYIGNAVTVTGGVNGNALRLDGLNDYAEAAAFGDYNLAILGDLTLSLHANYAVLDPGSSENTLVTYGAAIRNDLADANRFDSESVNLTYSLRIRDDRRLEMFWEYDIGVNLKLVSTVAADINPNEWHHFVVTRDADDMLLRFYVDGVQLGEAVGFTELPTGGGSGFLHIGSALYGSGSFNGMIDELSIFNTVLLPGEIVVGADPGDLNGDGYVGAADLDIILAHWGQDVEVGVRTRGDAVADGRVNQADLHAVLNNWTDGTPPSLTIPEPGSLIWLGGCLVLTATRRHRDR